VETKIREGRIQRRPVRKLQGEFHGRHGPQQHGAHPGTPKRGGGPLTHRAQRVRGLLRQRIPDGDGATAAATTTTATTTISPADAATADRLQTATQPAGEQQQRAAAVEHHADASKETGQSDECIGAAPERRATTKRHGSRARANETTVGTKEKNAGGCNEGRGSLPRATGS